MFPAGFVEDTAEKFACLNEVGIFRRAHMTLYDCLNFHCRRCESRIGRRAVLRVRPVVRRTVCAMLAHAVPLIGVHGAARRIDRNLLEVCTEAPALCICVGEEPTPGMKLPGEKASCSTSAK